jgi:hypothetical protein
MRTKFWFESLKESDNSEYLGVHVRLILLKCISRKQSGRL